MEQDGWKLVVQREDKNSSDWISELYHVADDPLDQVPVLEDPHEAELHQRLMEWLEGAESESGQLELDQETMDELRALGYGG